MDNLILRYRHSLALFGYILLVFFIGLSFKLHLNESEKVRTNYIYIMRNSCERDNDTINAIGQVLRDNYYSNIQGYSPTDPRRITSRLSINL